MKVGKIYEYKAKLTWYEGPVECGASWTARSLVKLDAEGMAKIIEFKAKQEEDKLRQQYANEAAEIVNVIFGEHSYQTERSNALRRLAKALRDGTVEIKLVSEDEVFVP